MTQTRGTTVPQVPLTNSGTRQNVAVATPVKRVVKKWTKQEEDRLIANVKKSPNNLRAAFEQTSKEIQRGPKAVSIHWYQVVSKQNHALLLTCSGSHISINRKNGKGQPLKLSLYKRILGFLGLSY